MQPPWHDSLSSASERAKDASCTNTVFCMRSSLSLVTCELGDRQVSASSAQLVAATPSLQASTMASNKLGENASMASTKTQ